MLSSFLLSLTLCFVALEGGLQQAQPLLYESGSDALDPAPRVELLPAAVIVLQSGADVPPVLVEKGRPLGMSRRSWLLPAAAGQTGVALAREAVRWPGVEAASPDMRLPHRRHAVTFDDPWFSSQWYHSTLGTDALYALTFGEPTVRVAVIDSATDIAHPDLAAGIVEAYDVRDGDQDPSPVPGDFCFGGADEIDAEALCDEHGTAVTGIIGARHNNGEGVVGICPRCSLVPIRMIGEIFSTLSLDVESFERALDANADVINNSWGYGDGIAVPSAMRAVVERAVREGRGGLGTVVIFAAGNEDRVVTDDELSALGDVLSVSAVDRYGNPTPYTNSGPSIDLAAPSATVTTGLGGGYISNFGGTSAAAPVVSGLAGWILSVKPELTASEVYTLLIQSARPDPRVSHDENGHHPVFGYGVVDAERLAALVLGEDVSPEPVSTEGESTGGGCTAALAPWWLFVWVGFKIRRSVAR